MYTSLLRSDLLKNRFFFQFTRSIRQFTFGYLNIGNVHFVYEFEKNRFLIIKEPVL